jgi:hypothetical protein
LLELSKYGWQVFSGLPSEKPYYLEVSPEKIIEFQWQSARKTWSVSARLNGSLTFIKQATDFTVFKQLTSQAMLTLGDALEAGPATVRLSNITPGTNKIAIASLAQGGLVNSIFDPYVEDKSLATLITLKNLGLGFTPQIKILTTSKALKKLSLTMINDF